MIDQFTRHQLLTSTFHPEAKKRAKTLVTSFRNNVSGKALAAGEDNQDEIEAISILYSRRCAAEFHYGQVKELDRRLSIKPFQVSDEALV